MKQFDQIICDIIRDSESEDYDEKISNYEDPRVFYQLSSLRRGVLGWFPFSEKWDLLEIGAGYGALTGIFLDRGCKVDSLDINQEYAEGLKERYSSFPNLQVLCQDILTYQPQKRYDCIVMEHIPNALRGNELRLFERIRHLLKEDGLLIAGFRNEFGLHGKQLRGSEETAKTRYDRACFEQLAQDNQLHPRKAFYLLPNCLYPQLIVTEEDWPERIDDRVIDFDPYNTDSIEVESVYRKLINNNLFPGLIDDVLEIFTAEENTAFIGKNITRVYLSIDRGRDYSTATVLYEDGYAEKIPMYPSGKEHIRYGYENLRKLRDRGLNTVETEYRNGIVRMQRIRENTLLDKLNHLENPKELYDIVDLVREQIIQASDGWNPQTGILNEGYIDMIPFNIFVVEGNFIYFDQEFCQKNCQLGYILFRMIYYSYLHIPQLEKIVPLQEIKKKYDLFHNWNEYEKQEQQFLNTVRHFDRYRQIWRWKKQINRPVLKSREKQIESIHRIQKELWKTLDHACNIMGLHYFAIHGTLLGAVRHEGFIPWDDDMDFAMPRRDYDKLLVYANALFQFPFFLQTEDSDRACFFGGYARLCNENTTCIEYPYSLYPCHQGIHIDIFPLDYYNPVKDKQKEISHLQQILYTKYYPLGTGMLTGLSRREAAKLSIEASSIPGRLIRKRLLSLYKEGASGDSLSIKGCLYGKNTNTNVFPASWFAETMYISFEKKQIPVPVGYKEILNMRFGRQYMNLPPVEKRVSKHFWYLDPDKSYLEQDRTEIYKTMINRCQIVAGYGERTE